MPSIVKFNGVQYLLSRIRTQAAIATDAAIKRADAVLSLSDIKIEIDADLPVMIIDPAEEKEEIPRVIVYQFGGKFYVLNGLELAIEKFKESKSGTIKAKLLSKHMLKKCVPNYEGAKIVAEIPEPPRRFTQEFRSDYSRPKYNRDR